MDQTQNTEATLTKRTPRAALIDGLADDISCGYPAGKYDSSFFLDSIIDDGRIRDDDVAALILRNDSEARIAAVERIREMVKADAIKFFTDDARGIDYINDRMAEQRHEAETDAEYLAKYGETA